MKKVSVVFAVFFTVFQAGCTYYDRQSNVISQNINIEKISIEASGSEDNLTEQYRAGEVIVLELSGLSAIQGEWSGFELSLASLAPDQVYKAYQGLVSSQNTSSVKRKSNSLIVKLKEFEKISLSIELIRKYIGLPVELYRLKFEGARIEFLPRSN